MDPLHLLPSELVLDVLQHVSLADLSSLRRLNKAWNELVTSNEDSIFKQFALGPLHVRPPCDHPDEQHKGWKQICTSWLLLALFRFLLRLLTQTFLTGQCSINAEFMRTHKIVTVDHVQYPTDFHPWRIKVDREHQLLFASTTDMPSDFIPDPARPMELPRKLAPSSVLLCR